VNKEKEQLDERISIRKNQKKLVLCIVVSVGNVPYA